MVGDPLRYVPTQQVDVILFRDFIYHVMLGKLKTILSQGSQYLHSGGFSSL